MPIEFVGNVERSYLLTTGLLIQFLYFGSSYKFTVSNKHSIRYCELVILQFSHTQTHIFIINIITHNGTIKTKYTFTLTLAAMISNICYRCSWVEMVSEGIIFVYYFALICFTAKTSGFFLLNCIWTQSELNNAIETNSGYRQEHSNRNATDKMYYYSRFPIFHYITIRSNKFKGVDILQNASNIILKEMCISAIFIPYLLVY